MMKNLRDFTISLNKCELHLCRDDFVLLLKINFVMRFNENNDKFKSKFENFKKKKNNSKKKEIENNENINNNI